MGSTNNRIAYRRFLQAYGLDKEAWPTPTPPGSPRRGTPENPVQMAPPAPAFMNSQARKKMLTPGFNLNFNNRKVQEYTAKYAPQNRKYMAKSFTGPKSWKQKLIADVYGATKYIPGGQQLATAGAHWAAGSDDPWLQRLGKAVYTGSAEGHQNMGRYANKDLKSKFAPYLKGAVGAAAIGIPMAMMMGGGQRGGQQQANPDPRTVELQRRAAAMQPGVEWSLDGSGRQQARQIARTEELRLRAAAMKQL